MDAQEPRRTRIAQKWGFGMAPVKLATQAERQTAARTVLGLSVLTGATNTALAALPIVKGLFSRAHRQDQWDWFTVWSQLGRPGGLQSRRAADALGQARRALVEANRPEAAEQVARFRHAGGTECLRHFLGEAVPQPADAGHLYILSSREQPRMLKIGFTTRSVESRVKEINAATGVLVPFGVRAVWVVDNPRDVEAQVHQLLADHRVRADREFFDLDFYDACRIIRGFLDAGGLEL